MNRDKVTEYMRASGASETDERPGNYKEAIDLFERFSALVAAHEREECAKVCEETTETGAPDMHCETKAYASAAAIRARGNE